MMYDARREVVLGEYARSEGAGDGLAEEQRNDLLIR